MNGITATLSDLNSILASGASLLLSFLCLLNVQGVNKSGNRWLGIILLCIFFLYVDEILTMAGINMGNATVTIIILNISAFVFAPAFYYTVSYFIAPDRPWKIKDYFHLFSLAIIYVLLSFYILQDNQVPAKQGLDFLLDLVSGNFGILFCLQVFYYCGASWLKLQKHEKNIRLFNATIENIDLNWLKYVVICVLLMASFFIINILINFSYFFVFEGFYLIGLFVIAYFSIKQKEIYPFTTNQKQEILHTIIEDPSKKQEPKKLIEDHKLAELKATLLQLMETDKPYLDGDLTLVKLAAMLNISLHQLSYLINTGFNENFYQFINRYRIEETKKLLLDEKMNHLSFQGIALEVGFRSKSVFNLTFKKYTGQTPSEYKEQNTPQA